MKNMYDYINETWKRYYKEKPEEYKQYLIKWRREPRILRIEKPTRLDRARALGYKEKQGYIIVRVRVSKGGMKIQRPSSGRRQKHAGSKLISGQKSKEKIALERAQKKYVNLKPLGLYYVGEDGKYVWYEIIFYDPAIVKN
ncbi:MAG: 50S ribosomal protein L15e [Nitrososphaeria archaeon]|jgi:large subunit ribosomal protein L15e